ncbi:hypothetical protein [Paractinoplanes lichenicola]|uniref:hypothetical protein n=1 Tax=Paractinoplanes lichenicola TaxID=2802976 RepID=UPI003F68D7DB
MIDRAGLADLLRRRRELLRPADAGLTGSARRRTPGLRREEVAQLANISTNYYARLGQCRGAKFGRTGRHARRAALEPDAVALATSAKLAAGVRYSTSKLCTVMYAYELHRRLRASGSTVSSIAYDPDAVPETGFLRSMPRPVQRLSTSAAMKWFSRRIGITTSDVAFSGASLAALAVAPEHAQASGQYFQAHDETLTAVRAVG